MNSTIHVRLKLLGLISKLHVCVPYVLTKRNSCHRGDVGDLLLKGLENVSFLKRILTTDEKWVACNNVKRKRLWTKKMNRLKALQKGDLFVLVGFQRNRFIELLPDNTMINSEVYYCHLDKLNDSFKQKRPELIIHLKKNIFFEQPNNCSLAVCLATLS